MASIQSNGNFKSYFFSCRFAYDRRFESIGVTSRTTIVLSCKYINSNVFNFDAFTRVYPTWRVHVSPKRKKNK